jgi:hypothetical protein
MTPRTALIAPASVEVVWFKFPGSFCQLPALSQVLGCLVYFGSWPARSCAYRCAPSMSSAAVAFPARRVD